MTPKTLEVKQNFLAALEKATNMEELEQIRVEYTGKKGFVTELLKDMKNLSNEEKKTKKIKEIRNHDKDKIFKNFVTPDLHRAHYGYSVICNIMQ